MSRIYVGNLPMDVRERDLEDLFRKYGRIRDIDLKTPSRPPAYAFVSFYDDRDGHDAIRGRDGCDFDGNRLRVELAKGARGPGGYREDRDRDRFGGGGRALVTRRTDYQVIITGLPTSASWQDLKDHMRRAGDVIFSDVDKQGGGVVEFATKDEMFNAVRKLDRSEFSNPFIKGMEIRVRLPRSSKYADRSASRSPRRSYDRSRSRSRSRSNSRGRRGGSKGRKESRSRSRSGGRDNSRPKDSPSRSRSKEKSPSKNRRSRSRGSDWGGSRSRSISPAGSARKEPEEEEVGNHS